MTSKKTKPTYKTLTIKKDDGSSIQVSRTSLQNIDTLLELQDRIVERYVMEDGAIGVLLQDSEFVSDLSTLCSLLPVVGKEDEYLNFEDIQENWEQLITLFCNGGLDEDTREVTKLAQPKVSQLHFLPFAEMLQKHMENRRNKEKR